MDTCGIERVREALRRVAARPPVRGITFVDPALLGSGDADGLAALVRVCERLDLDFAFAPVWMDRWQALVRELAVRGIAPFVVVPGVAWAALEALGLGRGLRDAAREPRTLVEQMETARRIASESASAAIAAGAAALVIADDMAGSGGPLLPLQLLEEEAFPRLAAVARLAHEAAVPAFLHCDGDVRRLLPSVVASGFAGVHGDAGGPLLPEVLAGTRAQGLALLGGIPTGLLADALSGAGAGRAAARLAAGGGLLVCDDGGVSNPGEAAALLEALKAAATV